MSNLRKASLNLWLVSNWNPYMGDKGEWNIEIEYWKPSETDTKVILDEFTVERSVEMTHEQLTGLQMAQYDLAEAHKEGELVKDKIMLNNLRQELLALPHLPDNDDKEPF
jgi:hypothetical protein